MRAVVVVVPVGGGAVGWCFRLGDLVQVGMFQVIKWGEGCVHVGEGWWVHVRGGGGMFRRGCSGGGVQGGSVVRWVQVGEGVVSGGGGDWVQLGVVQVGVQ